MPSEPVSSARACHPAALQACAHVQSVAGEPLRLVEPRSPKSEYPQQSVGKVRRVHHEPPTGRDPPERGAAREHAAAS